LNKVAVEISVGIFVFIGLLCLTYLTITLGRMEMFGDDYYYVNAHFSTVSGLKERSTVEMAGVPIGQVHKITLEPNEQTAVVSLKIRSDVQLSEDVIASVRTRGMIGDKYVIIEPGGAEVLLKDGQRILETEPSISLEELLSRYVFGQVSGDKAANDFD
jgi:phospholipid/cholesterol/gamma-HCH transport system substrate-binding protein